MYLPQVKEFIREQADLFWYIPDQDKEQVSEACLVETILNYASMDAVIRSVKLLGIWIEAAPHDGAQEGYFHAAPQGAVGRKI